MAVGDIEEMKKFATIKRLAMQIEYHIEIEESYPAFITKAVYENIYVDKPNKHPIFHRWVLSMKTSKGFVSQLDVLVP